MVTNKAPPALGKLLYGVLFVLGIPVLLVAWAALTENVVPLPVLPYPWAGAAVAAIGVLLMLGGVGALWAYGHGLPMSPYPPPVYVTRGVYRYTSHPIYVGFVLLCLGAATWFESPSAIWLVTPAVALGCAALALGHERQELRRRFGGDVVQRPLIALPPASSEGPTGWDRLSVFVLVLLPWSAAFEAVFRLGVPQDAIEAYLPFERSWPVLQWTEAIYGSVYVLVIGALFAAHTRRALRHLAVTGLIATAVVTLIYLTVPVIAPPRAFEPQSVLGHMLVFERAMSHTVAAFPAFHVIWSLIAAEAWASRSSRVAVAAWSWAILITVSCLTTGMHALADIIAAVAVYLVLRRYRTVWAGLRRVAERVANSWREWRVDGVRLINHGVYAALGGAVGFAIAATLAGASVFWQLVFVHFAGLIGAGLWAQKLEGSPKLSRPFGYYGSVLGGIAGALVAGALGGNAMMLLAVIALEAPWVQAIGRMRCLVQGCCHGYPTSATVGIRYWCGKSRVVTLGGLENVPLHPTPVYSMLGNVVIGLLLLRLWWLGAAFSLIAGVYLVLAGVARFVEESYRGEPQTLLVGGLRIYQWLAILSFVAGAALTAIPSGRAPGFSPWWDLSVILGATGFGLAAGFAMGVDFPGSARRFARLAPP
ncbi:MAG: prolipoprotein diacylglyceryl transferase [Gemmatimonadota bacterium]|nr:prolipoprotein diacylglyceryl transferase [Gemmatimonadota bacterium]